MTHKNTSLPITLTTMALLTAACGGGDAGNASETWTVVVGTPGAASDAGFLIAESRGYFEAVGITTEYKKFAGGGDIIPVLSTGRVNVGGLSINSGLVNAIAGGNDLRIVADKGSYTDGSEPSYGALLVSPENADSIKSAEDLKGKTIAVGSAGSTLDVSLSDYLGTAGLTLKDVKMSVLGQAERVIALEQGAADVAFVFEPYLTQAIKSGVGEVMADGGDLSPRQQTAAIVYSGAWAEENPEIAQDWMSAYVCGLQDLNDAEAEGGSAFDEVIEIIAEATGDDPEQLKEIALPALEPDGALNTEDVKYSVDSLVKLGLAEPIETEDSIDESYTDGAKSCDEIRSAAGS